MTGMWWSARQADNLAVGADRFASVMARLLLGWPTVADVVEPLQQYGRVFTALSPDIWRSAHVADGRKIHI
jgi:hypothetical protein